MPSSVPSSMASQRSPRSCVQRARSSSGRAVYPSGPTGAGTCPPGSVGGAGRARTRTSRWAIRRARAQGVASRARSDSRQPRSGRRRTARSSARAATATSRVSSRPWGSRRVQVVSTVAFSLRFGAGWLTGVRRIGSYTYIGAPGQCRAHVPLRRGLRDHTLCHRGA